MDALLLLTHRIPFPPNKGDKIRSYHLLAYLAERYRVFLGSFVDDPADWAHAARLESLCAGMCLRPLRPLAGRARSLLGLLSDEPLTLPYYRDARLRRWVQAVVREQGIGRAVVFSSSMAQYLEDGACSRLRRVADLVDVDSAKWRQYARDALWPASWIYRREGERLQGYEAAIARGFDASLLVSADEAALLKDLVPEAAERIGFYQNGVDTGYFDPGRALPDPFPHGQRSIVFTGAMDYRPNVEAVAWFARRVLPSIRAELPQARFVIVGARPAKAVRRLASDPAVEVVGGVPDVRPYLRHAELVVAPLLMARGVQNKVLEALAMSRPVVATPPALEGLSRCAAEACLVADDPRAFAAQCLRALAGLARGTAAKARECVCRDYDWTRNLEAVQAWLADGPDDARQRAAGAGR